MNRTPTTSRRSMPGGLINAEEPRTFARVGLVPSFMDLLSLYGIHASTQASSDERRRTALATQNYEKKATDAGVCTHGRHLLRFFFFVLGQELRLLALHRLNLGKLRLL